MNQARRERAPAHERIQAMLPWYVNGTLDEGGQAQVRAHLRSCSACREEAALHERIAAHVCSGRQVHPVPLASLDHLMERIEAHEARRFRRWLQQCGRWLRGKSLERALIAQAVTICLLVLMLAWLVIRPEPTAEYRTLGSPPNSALPAAPQLRVQLHDSLTTAQVQRLLLRIDGQIVHGPTADGVYIIELAEGVASDGRATREIATWLSEQPGVERATVATEPELR